MQLNLTRPLIFFDLETTGTNVTKDRIVEICVIKVFPDGHTEEYSRRINPTVPIPAEATAVHHITDEMVENEKTFVEIAPKLLKYFENCDIAGYNSNKFDVPLLIEEFGRAGHKFEMQGRHFIDVQNIFHKMEQRTLIAAYRFYCGKELEGAHAANNDTKATYEVLMAQLDRYSELKNDVEYLSKFSGMDNAVDLQGMVRRNEHGTPIFGFGKHKGQSVADVFRREPSYYSWIMNGDFAKNTKDVLTVIYNSVKR